MSRNDDRQIEKYQREESSSIAKNLLLEVISSKKLGKMLSWYWDWTDLPKDTYLISYHYRDNGKVTFGSITKSFHSTRGFPTNLDGEKGRVIFTLDRPYNDFPYKLSKYDQSIIKRAIPELWKRGMGRRQVFDVDNCRASPFEDGEHDGLSPDSHPSQITRRSQYPRMDRGRSTQDFSRTFSHRCTGSATSDCGV